MIYKRPKTFFYKLLITILLLIITSYPLHTFPFHPLRNTLKTKKMIRNQIEFLNKRLKQSKEFQGKLQEVKEEADQSFYGFTAIFSVVSMLIYIYTIRGMNRSFIPVKTWYSSSAADPENQRLFAERTLQGQDPADMNRDPAHMDRLRIEEPTLLRPDPPINTGYPIELLTSPFPHSELPPGSQSNPENNRQSVPNQPDHQSIRKPVGSPTLSTTIATSEDSTLEQPSDKKKKRVKRKEIKNPTKRELLASLLPYVPESPACQQLKLNRKTTYIPGVLSSRTSRAITFSFFTVPLTFAGIIAAVFDEKHRKYKDNIEKTVSENAPVFVVQPLYNRLTREYQLTVTQTPVTYPSSVPDTRRQSIDQFFYSLMDSFRSREKQINDLYQDEQKRLNNDWYHAGTWGLQRNVKFLNTVILAEKKRQQLYEQEISTLRHTLDQLSVQ